MRARDYIKGSYRAFGNRMGAMGGKGNAIKWFIRVTPITHITIEILGLRDIELEKANEGEGNFLQYCKDRADERLESNVEFLEYGLDRLVELAFGAINEVLELDNVDVKP